MSRPVCLVCGDGIAEHWTSAVDIEYETTADRFDYYRCERCDCLVIDPVPRERLGEIYPPTYYSFASGEDALAAERSLVARLKERLDRRTFRRVLALNGVAAPRILDVGGGTGEICAGLVAEAGAGARGTVVDLDPETAAVARARGLQAAVGRFEDFTSEDRYDVILLLNLIEHVENPLAILRKARDMLTPRGVIWIQTPNWRALDARAFRRRNWAGLHCPRHWVIFSKTGLRVALPRAGLEPVDLRTTQGGAFWAASILGSLRRREPGRRGRPLVREPLFLPLAALGAGFDLATGPFRDASQVVSLARRAEPGA